MFFMTLLFLTNTVFLYSQTPVEPEKSGKTLIADACQTSAKNQCPVLLKFSAEWCPWCVDMKKIFQEKRMVDVLKGFELVELDVGKRIMVDGKKQYEKHFELMKKYAEKVFIPQLIVLDSQGKVLARLNPDDYEKKNPEGNDPEKLANILKQLLTPSTNDGGKK